MPCSTMASRPDVTCSPEATTASYSRASCIGEASVHQATSSLVLPAIAETTTATSWPASTSRFTWRATLRIRSILATDVPPNFMTRRPMTAGGFPERLTNLTRTETERRRPKGGDTKRRSCGQATGFLSCPAVERQQLPQAIEASVMRYIDEILQ